VRSYSSVLSHILGSHPQINGYCETHTKYRTYFDLWKLRRRVRKLTGEPLNGDYLLDKVLHDYPMARSILDSGRTRAIVLVRRPRETVRSIIEMGLTHSPVAWHRDFELVARYYETRLAGLLRLTEAWADAAVDTAPSYEHALKALTTASWPGNVRQLHNVVEQVTVLATTPLVPLALVQRALRTPSMEVLSYTEARQRFERDYLVNLLKITDGNVADAARLADRNRTEFYRLMQKHGLTPGLFRGDGGAVAE